MVKKRNERKMYVMLLFLLAAIMLMLVACGGGGGGQSAGVKNGAIELADARIDFGSNQIGDSSKSKLTIINLKDTDHESADGINSDLFELYLEEDLDQPVTVTIPMKDTVKPEGDNITPALGIGLPVTSKTDITNTLYSFIPAEIDGDNLVATFVPSEHLAEISVNGANGEVRPSQDRVRLGLFWMQTLFEDGGHFLVEFPTGNIKKDGWLLDYKTRPVFLNDLEDVYEAYLNKGYAYSKRSSWPMKVTIQSIDEMGYYSYTPWAPAEGKITLNRNLFASNYNATAVKPLLAHEFFHFVQGNYVGYTTELLWFDEATATYFESEKSGTFPSIVSEHKEKMFAGVFPKDNTAAHGYARMPLVKFLTNKVGEDGIKNAYVMVAGGASWDDALLSAFGPPANWAPDYYKAVVTGEITDYAPYTVHSYVIKGDFKELGATAKLEIPAPEKIKAMLENDESPLLGSANLNIEAFGAGLVAITIDEKNLDKLQDDMDPVVSAEGGHVTVLSARGKTVEVMSGGVLSNFKKASKDKTVFLVIVTGLHESGSKSYELKVEFQVAPTLDEIVGTYTDGTALFEEVYVDDSLWESSDEEGGCDAQILAALKGMEGQTKEFNIIITKTGENTGRLMLQNPEEDDDGEDSGMDYFPFTYNNGQLTISNSDEDGVYSGSLTAAYGKNKDIAIDGKAKMAQHDGKIHIVLALKGTKPL